MVVCVRVAHNGSDIHPPRAARRALRGKGTHLHSLHRRDLLKHAAAGSLAALLAACSRGTSPTNTPPPVATSTPDSAPTPTASVALTAGAGFPAALAGPSGIVVTASPQGPITLPSRDTIKVGIVTSITGLFASYTRQYLDGFQAGLDYVTQGTGAIGGRTVQYDVKDDTGDPATGVAAATAFIDQGYKIIAGSVVSGVALQIAPLAEQRQVLFLSGPATNDTLTGINRIHLPLRSSGRAGHRGREESPRPDAGEACSRLHAG